MTLQLLIDTGQALFGDQWQSSLARCLDVDPRTVRRWIAGGDTPRSGVWIDLARIVADRQAVLNDVAQRLQCQGDPQAGLG